MSSHQLTVLMVIRDHPGKSPYELSEIVYPERHTAIYESKYAVSMGGYLGKLKKKGYVDVVRLDYNGNPTNEWYILPAGIKQINKILANKILPKFTYKVLLYILSSGDVSPSELAAYMYPDMYNRWTREGYNKWAGSLLEKLRKKGYVTHSSKNHITRVKLTSKGDNILRKYMELIND